MLQSYFDYIFVHLRKKARLRAELSPKFLSTLGRNPARTRIKNPGPLTTLLRQNTASNIYERLDLSEKLYNAIIVLVL